MDLVARHLVCADPTHQRRDYHDDDVHRHDDFDNMTNTTDGRPLASFVTGGEDPSCDQSQYDFCDAEMETMSCGSARTASSSLDWNPEAETERGPIGAENARQRPLGAEDADADDTDKEASDTDRSGCGCDSGGEADPEAALSLSVMTDPASSSDEGDDDDDGERPYIPGCFEGPEKTLEVRGAMRSDPSRLGGARKGRTMGNGSFGIQLLSGFAWEGILSRISVVFLFVWVCLLCFLCVGVLQARGRSGARLPRADSGAAGRAVQAGALHHPHPDLQRAPGTSSSSSSSSSSSYGGGRVIRRP
jgi:hypothetical protein